VLGPACPDAAVAGSPIYAKACIVQFVPAVTDVEFARLGCDNVFRLVANDEQEAQALSSYFVRRHKGGKLTVVYTDIFYKRRIAQKIRDSLPADVKAAAQFEPLLDVTGAYDRLAARLQRAPPDVIYLALDNEPTIEFVNMLRQRRVPSLLLGGQRLLSESFWIAARGAAEGIHVIAPIASASSPQFRSTVDLLKQANVVPDLVALGSFAAIQVWSEAVRRAGGGDPMKVMQVLKSETFDTAIGRLAFDQKGDRRDIRYSLLVWRDGQLRPSAEWAEQ
jgi:branched-chain amino acid transport system substrate-binding protein